MSPNCDLVIGDSLLAEILQFDFAKYRSLDKMEMQFDKLQLFVSSKVQTPIKLKW